MPTTNIEIIVGTYEEFLLGYKVELKDEKHILKQSFADKSHSGALKCVGVQGHWIASGGTDDRIFIYDMRSRKQSQIILSHEGNVNALAFTPDQTHVLSGADDGRMLATRINTWQTEANWRKAHSGSPVTHIACHPSGKMALSLGTDLVLRTWNLVKGRVAYKTNLKSRNTLGTTPECLAWSPNGEYFTLSGQRVLEIWSIKTADVVRSVSTTAKPICIAWLSDNVALLGLEDGKLLWVNAVVDDEEPSKANAHNELQFVEAHKSRVKAICCYHHILVTASSSGEIKMWQVVDAAKRKLKEIAATNIGCRPTCIALLDLQQFGDNYLQNSTIRESNPQQTKLVKPKQPLQRGVVTIEYENDDESEEEEANDQDETVAEVEAGANSEDQPDDDDDDDDDEAAATSDDSSADEHEAEPVARLPKSKKHKEAILKRQKQRKEQQAVPAKKLKSKLNKNEQLSISSSSSSNKQQKQQKTKKKQQKPAQQ